jgi:membrane fusion protein (multidrug efflux system)
MSGTPQFLNRIYFWPIMSKQIVSVLFVLILVACSNSSSEENNSASKPQSRPATPPIQAEAYVVKARAMSEDLQVPGTLLPFEETEIRPEISGRLVDLEY